MLIHNPQPPFNSIRCALDALVRRAAHYADEAQKHTPPTSDLMRYLSDLDREAVENIRKWLDGDTAQEDA